ncbi:MAG: glycoside hydrolase family 1 protein [Clostridia bacterium]|nr:glycoside hydrolase family 1 protein [Clostridia bacterium]
MTDPFSLPSFSFPKNFIWGSATAGHQIEGDNFNSAWWRYEHEEHAKDPTFDLSGKACNSYVMFEEDNKILSTLHHQMYRLGIEWPRIEPNDGDFRIDEVEHYIKVFESLKEKGIKICLTLHHVSFPIWFQDIGEFGKKENVKYFTRFVEYVVPKIAKYVDRWIVLNEVFGGHWYNAELQQRKINYLYSHVYARNIIKQYSNAPVSSAHAFVMQQPKRQRDKFDSVMADFRDINTNEWLFHAVRTGEVVLPFTDGFYDKEIKDSFDFWAINTYVRNIVDCRIKNFRSDRYPFEKMKMLPRDFYLDAFNPECIIHNISRLNDRPVMITENGCSCDDDRFRIVFIAEYLSALNEVMKMGINVEGFLYWTLLDNYEWGHFFPKFGLVDVDRENGFKRTIKPSGYFLRDIIDNSGFNQDILRKYLTEIPSLKK